ncbi:3'-5' exonuclease [Gillisia limnaea]|uniref:3'-5' exonuclease n=1 Tax=Gillisia limnaea (strain DSM 15749 / LMG 21470 / R-8282) TaxID=865937 RepID=H2BT20_GILLR|nr:hypothetical protein Gilli_1937 [Gillisia limnaea DSM 15749]
MIHKLNLEHILFLDIETVPEEKTFKDLSEERKKLWEVQHLDTLDLCRYNF